MQNWFQGLVVEERKLSRAQCDSVRDNVKARPGVDPFLRVSIYRDMYPLRMVEAMQVDFPGVEAALGSEQFAKVVMDYVKSHPSRSWTLNRLGDHFPDYISRESKLRGRTFLSELATLELSLCRVFDAPEQAHVWTMADLESGRLAPVAASALHRFRYPVSNYLLQVDRGQIPGRPAPSTQRLLIYRTAYQMGRESVSEIPYELLRRIWKGQSLAAALEQVATRFPQLEAEQVQGWFRDWASKGLFRVVPNECEA